MSFKCFYVETEIKPSCQVTTFCDVILSMVLRRCNTDELRVEAIYNYRRAK